ncbi:MAG: squalene/phytoene synthase family protein, partial [Rhodobacterales bacterium]|nr:squalene/phytoene synthase family protein [Rhodobacterales bacterium]
MDTPDPAGDSHCQDQVRRHDRDRFLCAQFAPAEARADLAVLHAFNLEVAQVRETVTEPLIGRMRLQWWRDMLDRIAAGDPPVHPVAQPLAGVMARHGLSRPLLDALIDGREADLAEGPPATLAELEAYADATAGGLAVLALEILGVRDGDTVAAARRVGVAWALTGLIRAVPFQAARGWAMLPADLCAEAGVHPPTPGQNRAALGTVTAAMAL